jgi:hypothetical protein
MDHSAAMVAFELADQDAMSASFNRFSFMGA